jgi:hypothetical protein
MVDRWYDTIDGCGNYTLFHKLPSEIIPDLAPQRIFGATARLKKKKKKGDFPSVHVPS